MASPEFEAAAISEEGDELSRAFAQPRLSTRHVGKQLLGLDSTAFDPKAEHAAKFAVTHS